MRLDAPRKRAEPRKPEVFVGAMKTAYKTDTDLQAIRLGCRVELQSPAWKTKGEMLDLYIEHPETVGVPRHSNMPMAVGREAAPVRWAGPAWRRDTETRVKDPFWPRDAEQAQAMTALESTLAQDGEGSLIAPRGWGKRALALAAARAASVPALIVCWTQDDKAQWAYRLECAGTDAHPPVLALASELLADPAAVATDARWEVFGLVVVDEPPFGRGADLHGILSVLPARRLVLLSTDRPYDGCAAITLQHCGPPIFRATDKPAFMHPQVHFVDTGAVVADEGKATQRAKLLSDLISLDARAEAEEALLRAMLNGRRGPCCIVAERRDHGARLAEFAPGTVTVSTEERDEGARAERISVSPRVLVTPKLLAAHLSECAAKGLVVFAFPDGSHESTTALLAEMRMAQNPPVLVVLVDRACPTIARAAEEMKLAAERRGYSCSWRRALPAVNP